MQPLISIIVPVYRVEKELPACIESILKQTCTSWELLLIDDGSPDRCGEICRRYAAQDQRLQVLRQANLGLSAARNRGIACSRGEYLCFVDGDDFVLPHYLSGLLELLEKNRAELSVCGITEFFPGGKEKSWYDPAREQVLSGIDAAARMLYRTGIGFSVCNKLFRRDVFTGLHFPEGQLFEDFALTYRLLARCKTVAWGKGCWYCYRNREGSITNSPFTIQMFDLLAHADDLQRWVNQNHPELTRAAESAAAYAEFSLLRRLAAFKEGGQYSRELLKRVKGRTGILSDPCVPMRDKAALAAAFCGWDVFRLCWNSYDRFRRIFR